MLRKPYAPNPTQFAAEMRSIGPMDKQQLDSKGLKESQTRLFNFVPSGVLREPSRRFRLALSNWPIFLAFLLLFAFSGAYLFTVFPDWRHLTSVIFRPPDEVLDAKLPPPPEDARPTDLIAKLPIDLRKELMSRDVQSTARFSRRFVHPISRICDALGATGVGRFSISLNPVSGNRKVCTSDIVPIGEGTGGAEASSIFVWALGSDDDSIGMFRVKINLNNPQSAEATKAAALVVLKRLHEEFRWDLPSSVERGLQDMQDATVSYFGIVYQLTREWSSVPRLNVIIRAKDLSGILSSESFQRVVGATAVPRLTSKPYSPRTPTAGSLDIGAQQPVEAKPEPIENLYR